jgi:hypothetical protein
MRFVGYCLSILVSSYNVWIGTMTYLFAIFRIEFPDRLLAILDILGSSNDVITFFVLLGHESDIWT